LGARGGKPGAGAPNNLTKKSVVFGNGALLPRHISPWKKRHAYVKTFGMGYKEGGGGPGIA